MSSHSTHLSALTEVQHTLAHEYDDHRHLTLLTTFLPTGVADATQLRLSTGLSRGQLDRVLDRFRALADDDLVRRVPFPVPKPGVRGRPSTLYALGPLGAALLQAHGHPDAHPCGLDTETSLAHARAILDVHLVAQAAGLAIATEQPLPYPAPDSESEPRVLRPDLLVTLPDGPPALFEVEQAADLSLLRRIRDSVRRKVAFYGSPAAADVSPTVRVLVNLPHGPAWDKTIRVWERATAIVAQEHAGQLGFRLLAIPLLDFLDRPDWSEPPLWRRWESLFDPASTSAFEPPPDEPARALAVREKTPPRPANIPQPLRRRSAQDDYLVMEAFWFHVCQHGRHLVCTDERPYPSPVFFDTMAVIYAASHPPDASPWERALHPHASLYLLLRYLQMHQPLRAALSKSITRGSSSIKWSTPSITHRMQSLFDVFLRYHGFRSGDAIRVHVVVPWQRDDGRGDFGVRVRIEPEVLMGQGDGVVPTRDEAQAAEQALAWVLLALLRHSDELGLKRPIFW